MEWHTAFRVLAHEIRSPVGVIGGYARMLDSGRLDETGRADALRQVGRAAARLEQFGHQASELARWLEPRIERPEAMVAIDAILDDARQGVTAPARVTPVTMGERLCVRTSDPRALASAFTAVVNVALRELDSPDAGLSIEVRHREGSPWCDVLIGSPANLSLLHDPSEATTNAEFALDRGGFGLQLILGAAVFEAHNARLWTAAGHRALTGVRLPAGAPEQK